MLQITDYSFDQLPFSKLFKTYVHNFDALSDFFEVNPFDTEAVKEKAQQLEFKGDRKQVGSFLQEFNASFDIDEAAQKNIERLKSDNALVVVTGQQLGVLGGPLYTIFKTISTIHQAKKLERTLHRPVIPVFWLADEDHDYDEVRKLTVIKDEEPKTFSLPPLNNNHLPTVAEIALPKDICEVKEELKQALYNTDFSNDLWDLLDESFKLGNTFFKAFGLFISRLFSKHGLVLAGSNHPKAKALTTEYLKTSVLKADQIRENLQAQSEAIGQRYHKQVTLYDSNLFYLDDEAGRTKISHNGQGWMAEEHASWESEQLVGEIDEHPERFSPNVFMRPILQDALLPTIGYVAGPGETAYYGQMKSMYECFGLSMPIIFPRFSATLIEPAIDRICNELPFEFHEFGNRIEDLESDYVTKTNQHDIEGIFKSWLNPVEKLTDEKKEDIKEIDPTLEAAAEKATSIYINELNKLKGKVYRSVKKQDQTQLRRIRRIKANLFPGDDLQERTLAAIFFMNKYGVDLWDKLLDAFDENEDFDQHKLVYL